MEGTVEEQEIVEEGEEKDRGDATENNNEEEQRDEGGEISFHAFKGGPTGKLLR